MTMCSEFTINKTNKTDKTVFSENVFQLKF